MLLRCFPRIHIGLMDMGDATARRYGGAGFTLSCPVTELIATPSERISIQGLEKVDAAGRSDLMNALERLSGLNHSPRSHIIIKQLPLQHVGLGTKSSLLLGAMAVTLLANGQTLPDQSLQKLSGRGGASGIGVNSFFEGGFITDAGHPSEDCSGFAPSSRRSPNQVPPIISRINIPQKWNFYLLLPPGNQFSGTAEQKFFEENTPLPRSEVLDSIALLYHGIVPAVIAEDLTLLKSSIADLHRVGFKKRELTAQSENVKQVVTHLSANEKCAVGLSSMGPLVYVIADERDSDCDSQIVRLCQRSGTMLLEKCKGRNTGFEVKE